MKTKEKVAPGETKGRYQWNYGGESNVQNHLGKPFPVSLIFHNDPKNAMSFPQRLNL